MWWEIIYVVIYLFDVVAVLTSTIVGYMTGVCNLRPAGQMQYSRVDFYAGH